VEFNDPAMLRGQAIPSLLEVYSQLLITIAATIRQI
jgi:hypothetical protein